MKYVYPDFYKDFHCTASSCRHSCCVGWEIDIDEKSMSRYSNIKGEFGDRLRKCIESGEEPHFILDREERCPFLRADGLCDMILTLGEDALCQVCTDHPRFRTFLSDRTETGLGLCCEEAARQLLTHEAPLSFISQGEECPNEEEAGLIALRERALKLLQDRRQPLENRMLSILDMCDTEQTQNKISRWAEFCYKLERLDEGWTAVLDMLRRYGDDPELAKYAQSAGSYAYAYENLAVYFIYRHLFTALEDGDTASKLRFAVLSVWMIYTADAIKWQQTGRVSLEERIEHVRLYSSEIEYSQENMDAIFDILI